MKIDWARLAFRNEEDSPCSSCEDAKILEPPVVKSPAISKPSALVRTAHSPAIYYSHPDFLEDGGVGEPVRQTFEIRTDYSVVEIVVEVVVAPLVRVNIE